MDPASKRLFSSLPASPALIPPLMRLLAFIDELPPGATGVLHFGEDGVILLESRRICWAIASVVRMRLTDILRNQSSPRLPRAAVEDIYQSCKLSGRPIGEALVASGLISEPGLRGALLKHTGAGLLALAHSASAPSAFTVHTRASHDPRFSFAACELAATLCALDDPARAVAAQVELESMLVHETSGVAFVRSEATSGALPIAVDRSCAFPVQDLVEICNWVSGLFDVVRTCDPTVSAARATWGRHTSLVTWRAADVNYVGLCASRAAAARLVSKLGQRAATSGVFVAAKADGGEHPA
jgi:hypothetical protein